MVIGSALRTAPRVGFGMLVLGTLALSGCAYRADSFVHVREPFRGSYVTIGCLDLAIDYRRERADSRVVAYSFGNRCDAPALVDLSSARVYGHTRDGASIELVAFDPKRELRPLRIDGRSVGREAIGYPSSGAITSICVDVASIAHANPPRWLCFNDPD